MEQRNPKLHPQVQKFVSEMPSISAGQIWDTPVSEFRNLFEQMATSRITEKVPVNSVTTLSIPGPAGLIETRIYDPLSFEGSKKQNFPLLVYFHGGGHVVGSLDSHDSVARFLCAEADCVVASVDYRLAPENKFPAAIEDGYAATKWLANNCQSMGYGSGPLIIAGDSAGGNIAAVVALLARDDKDGPKIDFQILFYPVTDYSCSSNSYEFFGTGYGGLTKERMRWFQSYYLPDNSYADDWRASPLKAPDLSRLPKALIITAECDVLHDEGAEYAKALEKMGSEVEYIDWPGMIHGFIGSAAIFDEGKAALRLTVRRIKEITM